MPARITPKPNGSLKIEGEFEIVDMEGNVFDIGGRSAVSLCRCGASKNKPFCDGSHREIGFSSDVKAFPLTPPKPKS